MLLCQEMRWAYYTTLPIPHGTPITPRCQFSYHTEWIHTYFTNIQMLLLMMMMVQKHDFSLETGRTWLTVVEVEWWLCSSEEWVSWRRYVVVTQRPRMHHGITGRRRRRRGATENQLLQAVEAVDQSVLVGHQLEVALVEAEYQLVLLKLVTCHQTKPQRSLGRVHVLVRKKD